MLHGSALSQAAAALLLAWHALTCMCCWQLPRQPDQGLAPPIHQSYVWSFNISWCHCKPAAAHSLTHACCGPLLHIATSPATLAVHCSSAPGHVPTHLLQLCRQRRSKHKTYSYADQNGAQHWPVARRAQLPAEPPCNTCCRALHASTTKLPSSTSNQNCRHRRHSLPCASALSSQPPILLPLHQQNRQLHLPPAHC
jgi:hypothetical protein